MRDDGEERPIRMMIVYAGDQGGFYLALVPSSLSEERMEAALHELGVDARALYELGGWRTSSEDVAVAFVPAPEPT
jgi:hypothetical protein